MQITSMQLLIYSKIFLKLSIKKLPYCMVTEGSVIELTGIYLESKDITIAIIKSIAFFQIVTSSLKIITRYICTELTYP